MLLQKGSDFILSSNNISIVFKMEAIILLCLAWVFPQWKPGVQFEQFKEDMYQLEKVWRKRILGIKHKEWLKKLIFWFGLEKRKVKKSKLCSR